jgi:hypothetical protein
LHNRPKRGNVYQLSTKLPNVHKIYQMAVIGIFQVTIKNPTISF